MAKIGSAINRAFLVRALRRVARRVYDFPANCAFKLVNMPICRRYRYERRIRAVALFESALRVLSPGDQRIVRELQADGVCVVHLSDFDIPESENLVADAATIADGFADSARRLNGAGKQFLIVDPVEVARTGDIFTWGLNDRIIDIVEAYLGLQAAYDGPHIVYTPAHSAEASARRWHVDREDQRMIKIVIYLNDVDEDGGPFQILAPQENASVNGFRKRDDLHSDHRMFEMPASVEAGPIRSCVGRAGTVIFADTARCYHRGMPGNGSDRKALFFSYFSQRPLHPFYCERSGIPRRLMRSRAQDMGERQREALLWRRHLPFYLRIIPSARI